MMKDDIQVTRLVLFGLFFLVIALGFSIWNFTEVSVEENHDIEAYLASLNDSLEAEFMENTVLDSNKILDSSPQHILFIGDSMAEGLRYPLQQYADYNQHQMTTIAKRSATIVSWVGRDSSGRLRKTIEEIKPSYLIICLGSNELFTRGVEQYRTYIRNILKQSAPYKLIWICPPNWKKDRGLTDMMAEEIGEKRFFPSKTLNIPRAGDGIHPTYQGYFTWADSIATWIMHQSRHRILLEKPVEKSDQDTLLVSQTRF